VYMNNRETGAKRILLVEDDPNDVELTVSALAEHHLDTEIRDLRDGAEALDYLYRRGPFASEPSGHPSVILLDIKMPKVDGLSVLRQVRADPALWMIPVVMFTSSREEQDVIASYQLGVNAYVVKPLEYNEFMAALREIGLFWGVLNEPPPGSARRHR
jgi:CheY-like chemotaxis protein